MSTSLLRMAVEDVAQRRQIVADPLIPVPRSELLRLHAALGQLLGARPAGVEHLREDDKLLRVVHAVAEYFGVQVWEITGPRKFSRICWPRQVGMYLARRYTGRSLREVGEVFGGRHHSAVSCAVNTVIDRRDTEPQARADIETLTGRLLEVL